MLSVLGLLIYSQMALAQGSANKGSDPNAERTTFGPFALGGVHYTVTMESVPVAPAGSAGGGTQKHRPETLADVSVQDGSHRKFWERAFRRPDTPQATTVGTAYEVLGETGKGIVLEFGTLAPNRITAGWFVVLAERSGHLEQISPDVRFYGSMEHIPDAGYEQRRLVSGDKIRYQFWMGGYYLLRKLQVNFQARTVISSCARRCTFPVIAETNPLAANVTIELFDRPDGRSHPVQLRRQSRPEFVDAYVNDMAAIDASPSGPHDRPWLHVRIDGNDGWVPDVAAEELGLHGVKRADEP